MAGLFGANFLTWPPIYYGIALTVIALTTLILWRSLHIRRLAIFLAFLIAGQLYFDWWEQAVYIKSPYGQSITATISVVSCRESFRKFRCVGDVNHPFAARVTFEVDRELSPGSMAAVTGTVKPLPKEQSYLKGDGVLAVIEQAKLIAVSTPFSVQLLLNKVKTASENALARALTEPSASLAAGLLFGSRQQFSDDFVEALKRTNTLHIVAVSGFNITILVEFIRRLLSALPRKAVFFCTSFGIILFVAIIGAPASAVRAAIMGILLIFGNLIGRKPYPPSMIIFTALIMALPNPYILRFDLGFQLSFLAFIGLVGLSPSIERKMPLIPTPVRGLLAATLGASLATALLLIPLNNTVSLVGPITNMLILPVVPIIMLLGSLTLGLSFLSTEIARVVGLLLYLPSMWVQRAVELTASLPLASVHWLTGVGAACAIVIIFFLFRRRHASLY